MNESLKRIALILGVIVFIPLILFTFFQVSSLNSDEEIIDEIYKNQLESIIYSVNQYSEDYVSGWTTRINNMLLKAGTNPKNLSEITTNFMRENNSIYRLFIADSLLSMNIVFQNKNGSFTSVQNSAEISSILNENKTKIERLFAYRQTGYKKIESLPSVTAGQNTVLAFIPNTNFLNYKLSGVVIDPALFVTEVLAPKIQEISRDNIIISCYNSINNERVYSNFPNEEENFQREGQLWLLPNYKIAISLKGRTIDGLVAQRTVTNLILIILITLVLVAGVILVYRSIKKEIQFAQIRSDFVSNVSHELRTPLSLISMFAETLELNRVPTEQKKQEYYKIISQETNRLSRIVNTILNFSKMEAGKREYKFESTDLNEIVENVMATYNFHLKNQGFECKISLHPAKLKVNIDKEAISEAIINIVDNAVKYSGEKKLIEISTGSDGIKNYISVKDYGTGIAEADQKKIFDKFYRVSNGLVHNTKGTGMGLSIVKQIVDSHNGKIKLYSIPGEGSTFTLIFT
ncbi:MAG: HAMP domain-containing histidine kinase [Bacteroidetes bacterium]|nr:HAMP domain-containing histidine kinase [Bacteroidota bacterium]